MQEGKKDHPDDGPDRKIVGWVGEVAISTGQKGNVVVLERRDNFITGRLADPSDGEVPRVPIYEGDQLMVKTPIAYVSINAAGEVGRTDDYLTGMRVVPVRCEGNVIYGRSLRRGEHDTGDRIHVGPDDKLCFDAGFSHHRAGRTRRHGAAG